MGERVAWGDVDNDGDLDLLHWGFDQLGNGESQILINDVDLAGRRTFTTSFDLPAFDRIHQAEWGDWNRDGWIDLLVSGQRTGDDFIPRTVVEVLQNNGGISFDVVTPRTGLRNCRTGKRHHSDLAGRLG